MSPEERVGKFPTGVLKKEEGVEEFCDSYDKIIAKAKANKNH
jgi:2-oxoglutarate ferredoxin oxidoreductase subunit beta